MTPQEARLHIQQFHERIPGSKSERLAGSCFRIGTERWRRRDGKPFEALDIEAFRKLDLGQLTKIQLGSCGDREITMYYESDSSG